MSHFCMFYTDDICTSQIMRTNYSRRTFGSVAEGKFCAQQKVVGKMVD